MSQQSGLQQADLEALRDRAEERRRSADSQAARVWAQLIMGMDLLATPPRPLLCILADERILGRMPEGIHHAVATLADVVTNPGLAVGAEKILLAVPVGRLLTHGEMAGARRVLARRPQRSWRVATVGAQVLRDADEANTQSGILARMTSLLGGDPASDAPLLLGTGPGPLADQMAADAANLHAWAASPAPASALWEADIALLTELVDGLETKMRETEKTHAMSQVQAERQTAADAAAVERKRAEILVRLAQLADQVAASIPLFAKRFSLEGIRRCGAPPTGSPEVEQFLNVLWREAVEELRHEFSKSLVTWHNWAQASLAAVGEPAGLPPVSAALPSAPTLPALCPLREEPSRSPYVQAVLLGGGAGAAMGVALNAIVGMVVGAAAGVVVVPLLLRAYNVASGRDRAEQEAVLDRAIQLWRRDVELALSHHLAEMHTAVGRSVMAQVPQPGDLKDSALRSV